MTPDDSLPDFLVGIDFGQTYTGVVWTNLNIGSQSQPRSIQDWPGIPPHLVETKVPSIISYPEDGSEPRWGFLCDPDDEDYETARVHEHFKIYLDQESLDLANSNGLRDIPRTVREAKELVADYLRQIHQHAKFSIGAVTGSWKERTVEFVFSLPTTWNSLDTINRFKDAIDAAGFDVHKPARHSATVELTEAEAAAVYIATSPQVALAKGDIILICDAGGGTTDLGLIEVLDPDSGNPALRQVAAVKGVGIGSTMIDRAFELLVQQRLNSYTDHHLPEDLGQKVARSPSFQSIKHQFGIRTADKDTYMIPLDRLGLGISSDFTHTELGIQRGKMRFSRSEIKDIFDAQIRGIIGQITRQLDSHKDEKTVKFLFLSGGLGGSTYVNAQIQAYYQSHPHINAPGLVILRSQEPQLAVVKGLVMDRRQKLLSGAAALKNRIARASYGIICRQIYDKNLHAGEEVVMDSFNKKEKWATSQIDWLIKKGDIIGSDTARGKSFNLKLYPGEENRKWDITVVISHEDQKTLPTSFRKPGVYKLCQVHTNLEGVSEKEFELKNKRAWQGEAYYLATFTVKVIAGSADLKFELWFKDKKYTGSHDPISIEWNSAGASLRPQSRDHHADYWEAAPNRG